MANVTAQLPKRSFKIPNAFCKREKEDGLKISLIQVKERASISKSMIERVMRREKATEQKPQLTRGQLFKASLA